MFKWLDTRGYRDLRLRIDCLQAEHDALKSQHDSLRSRFYATRTHPSAPRRDRPAEAPVSVRAEKDAILREYLFGGRHVPDPKQPSPGEAAEAAPRAAGSDARDAGDAAHARPGDGRDLELGDEAAA